MAENVAVEGCTLEFQEQGQSADVIEIQTPASTVVKADGKGVYSGPLTVQVSAFTGNIIDVEKSGTGVGVIQPSSQKGKVEGKVVVLEGDSATFIVSGQKHSGDSTIPATEPVTLKITDAGQTVMQMS